MMDTMINLQPQLNDVPETMLWTLHNRAVESMRPDGIIKDDKAVSIFKSLDYDFEKSFGKAEPSHAIRSNFFDTHLKTFLTQHPEGVIVNLGEGLETQRFRIDSPHATWFSVDLPESIEIRERFIQPDIQHIHLPLSALDRAWLDAIPKDKPVFITAQGLFMYFEEQDVKALIQDIEATFNDWTLMFDTIPVWFSQKTLSEKGLATTQHYTAPKMPWGINRDKIIPTLQSWMTNKAEIINASYPAYPRGFMKWYFMLCHALPVIKKMTPAFVTIAQRKT